jgi:tripartite-type tricarboxylate transporter receptor subunit TctC
MAVEMLASAAGVKLTHVPYKGAAQALTDVVGGQVPLLAQGLGVVSAQAKAGKLRVLAVTGAERSPLLPDVPTVRESGFADFEFATWFAVVAPAGTPRAIIELLNAEIVKAAAAPEVRDALLPLGYDVAPGSPEQLTESIRAGLARMARIIREAGIKAE